MYAASGITGCHSGGCGQLASNFLVGLGPDYPFVYLLGMAGVIVAPAVIGIFWGAPLIARELETGTFRLAWTQSITRARWLAVKLALIGLTAMAVTEGLSLMLGWWAAPIGQAARFTDGSISPLGLGPFSLAFDAHGITPLGYAAFAFALGVTTGLLIRRTVPAMAVTLAIFAVVQVAFPQGIRPHLLPPAHTSVAIGPGPDGVGVHLQRTAIKPKPDHRHTYRPATLPPARRLDSLQQGRQRLWAAGQRHPGRVQAALLPRFSGLSDQPRHADRRHLPARQPLLGLPVDRNRHLRRPRRGPGRVLLLADQPPPPPMTDRRRARR